MDYMRCASVIKTFFTIELQKKYLNLSLIKKNIGPAVYNPLRGTTTPKTKI